MVVSSDVWLPSGSLIRTVTVAEIRARKARAGRGVSKDAVDGAAISATTLDPKRSSDQSAMRTRPVKWLDKGGLLHSTV